MPIAAAMLTGSMRTGLSRRFARRLCKAAPASDQSAGLRNGAAAFRFFSHIARRRKRSAFFRGLFYGRGAVVFG